MNYKKRILYELESKKGASVSGKVIGEKLKISRTLVWKIIEDLRSEGYQIEAVRNKGYCLLSQNDVLSQEAISLYLDECNKSTEIKVHKTIDSTNLEARKLALLGAPDKTVVIAEHQTLGKGRLGRTFYSPANTGIYMSIVLRPKTSLQNALFITVAASVCVCEAIERVTALSPKIKWVNDIYLNDKKVCGILTEASTNFENGEVEYIVLGIGINVSTAEDEFPSEIRDIAGSLGSKEHPINRNQLVAEIINSIFQTSETLGNDRIIEKYKCRSCVIGEKIKITTGQHYYFGTAIDIKEDGGLVVLKEDGVETVLNSGEISIRKMTNIN